ncbi:MAG: hypothetical protein ACE5NM_04600 [Sedimentisphaerales bacterium]
MTIFRRPRTAIGIDIGPRNIKAAQLRRADGQYHIVALALLPRPYGRGETEQVDAQEILSLRVSLRQQGFCGNDVVLAAPDEKLLRGILELPSRVSGAAVGQMARMELSRLHHVAPDSFELVHWELASADKSAVCLTDKSKPITQILAFGCPHDIANALLDAFEEAGLNVTALDVRSAAAARACLPLTAPAAFSPATCGQGLARGTGPGANRAGMTCLLDLQWNSTKLLLVWGHTPIYEKFITNQCIARLSARLGEKFGLPERFAYHIVRAVGLAKDPPAFLRKQEGVDQKSVEAIRKILYSYFEAVAEELKSPLAYASRQYPDKAIERILLIGDGAGIWGISQYLADNLGIEVFPAAPCNLVSSSVVHRGSSDESRGRPQPPFPRGRGDKLALAETGATGNPGTSDEGCAWPVLSKADNPDLTVAVGLAKFTGG